MSRTELSGQSQRAFAEARQVELSNLRYWIYKLRNESRPLATEKKDPPPAPPEQAERPVPARASRMLPVPRGSLDRAEGAGGEGGRGAPRARVAIGRAAAVPGGARLSTTSASSRPPCSPPAVLTLPRSVRIFIASTAIDMRKSIDGLMAIVSDEIAGDAYSGHLFVFVSRRCDRVKT